MDAKLLEQIEKKSERPGREIKIDDSTINNKNISVKIGTAEDKNCPKTVYVYASFWVDIKEHREIEKFDRIISKEYSKALSSIYKKDLAGLLYKNKIFPYYYDNIYVYNFPENLNYNNKRSFTSIEISLHTLNCSQKEEKQYSLKNKSGTEIYDELIKIVKIISANELLTGKLNFSIHNRKK